MKLKEIYHNARHSLTDLIHNTLFGKPDIIIIGETHTDRGHVTDEARMIRRHQPEYVLLEVLGKLEPEDTQESLSVYKVCTLNGLSQQIDVPLTDLGIDKTIFKLLEDRINQEIQRTTSKETKNNSLQQYGKVPRNLKQLAETPSYKLSLDFLSFLGEIIYKTYIRKSNEHEREICVYLSGFRGAEFEWNNELYNAIVQTGSKLAGAGIKRPKLRIDESKYLELIDYLLASSPKLEQIMGRRIVEYVKKRITERPVIAIVGGDHIKKNSSIYPLLEDAGIKYRIAKQISLER